MVNHKDTTMTAEECRHFLSNYSFGSLITADLQISHVPFIFSQENIIEIHLASGHSQLASLNGEMCLLNVLGPHAFIPTHYYLTKPAVPAWNYASVNLKGIATLMSSQQLGLSLDKMLGVYQPELIEDKQTLPDEFRQKMMSAITGVKIDLREMNGKLKLGQHRSPADQGNVFEQLAKGSEDNRCYARFAQDWLATYRPSVLRKDPAAR